ncbi:uncharacterized protein LOC119679743 [Teleopsis dalmanni]|uniref:uncharacterized protein LOC119679743 n=1 Tax=Teleopsis dalmanni TaxID=139649 RepID=UPI0018CF9F9B|nr:uncharacterized protein LOC119679743 [Teleopsis dalmanni]
MSSTPKWYCRNKNQSVNTFSEISKLGVELRRITKHVIMDVKMDIFIERGFILEESERIIKRYWDFKKNCNRMEFVSLSKKMKRSPYNSLLLNKFHKLVKLNDRRFNQFTLTLKKTLCYLFRKSYHSDDWFNWALQLTKLYNECCNLNVEDEKSDGCCKPNANVCSNNYPSLLLTLKAIDFSHVLQFISQTRIEQSILDLMLGLLNINKQEESKRNSWLENCESNCSSLEILRILTLNIGTDEIHQCFQNDSYAFNRPLRNNSDGFQTDVEKDNNQCRKHTNMFLERERMLIEQLLSKANEICPSILQDFNSNHDTLIAHGLRIIWSSVGVILDHILLWWMDTPITCYSVIHIDSIRLWMQMQKIEDIPEPVHSTLRGVSEILTNFVCNNIWDQLFRFTFISNNSINVLVTKISDAYHGCPKNNLGTATGTIWIVVFFNLVNLSNNFFPTINMGNSSLVPVSEQIPILHRIDHSVHSMRIWVTEQTKLLCCEWKMSLFFKILEQDVQICLKLFDKFKLPNLSSNLNDILMLVCIALRTKLICEVKVNIEKLKNTTEECVNILSSVCRILSLATFTLCFPPVTHWQQNTYNAEVKSTYVDYVLDQIFLPIIQATTELAVLKLILRIICESWLDFIYNKRIKFNIAGALRLLSDFDYVREWILNCNFINQDQLDKLSNHEVLRMCKGVGKILLRKPEDIISITKSPAYDHKLNDEALQETQLPSEMFISNQKNWLQLRAGESSFLYFKMCCNDNTNV